MSAFTDSLRELANFLENNPHLPEPRYSQLFVNYTREQLVMLAKAVPRAEKKYSQDTFALKVQFGEEATGIQIHAWTERATVCQKVVIGSHEEPERIIPAHVVEDVEWVCDEPLLAPDSES